ncbi:MULTISPECIES: GT4 family glycosyltransferase PelF [Bacillus]|jgi:glycosyltransferase involved in cell wall biosynthesis|uniref:GT4 family glycosyltransferase PelF n=4 Tax=Bacillus cereus group TaxID=86661 RepID=A0A1J9ZG71_9BACI|nr:MULTISPECIES: GT4 family glycosyltransferase PelF [Bacillus]AAS44486.1 glycosyl transferase, group 1 family protein [Bacillus cereus ATCC 10987]AFQ09525.1 glycoside hydrolase family protein [Bacillus cereus FRI-35]PGZ52758.1 glycoside hydrolase [Bacillus anthracis]AIE81882.1 glycoside hydrolase family protein [Bacillus cereus]KMQ33484.1 glycoside hydrolase [Bacillus cereus]
MRIGLVVEGSYPFVSGGVASWVQMIIQQFKEHEFTIFAIVPQIKTEEEYQYEIPNNVKDIIMIPLQSESDSKHIKTNLTTDEVQTLQKWFTFQANDTEALQILGNKQKLGTLHSFFESREFYEIVKESYLYEESSGSFLNYFWMWRSMFTPIIQILQIDFPELDLIHSVSTGYGGLLGAAISAKSDIPFILTEHGIYSREREEEILQSTWIPIEYKKRWVSFFHHLSHQAYEQAADVITLFGRNSAYQKELGAPAHKLKIVPNGVTLSDYKGLRKPKHNSDKLIISAIIRVVPIKDVKTMIYAAKLLLEKDIPFIFYLLGPDTEEPEYAQECRDLIQQLGLKEHVIMTGRVNIKDYLKQTDILVLTSISEGQPLAMLEGMASGLPWVVTDVGSCKELIYGQDEDPYGQCGFVVPPVSPEQVATHLEWYYRHPESIQQFGNNGRNRIEAYYQLSGVVDSYRKLYLERGAKTWQV